MKEKLLGAIVALFFLSVIIVCGGVMRGCSNDIDGRETYKWWAW